MFLPIRLTWNLQMPRSQKIGIFVLFGSGFICILFATLRTVEIGVVKGQVISPEPIWMSLWTVVETSTGTLTSYRPCVPALANRFLSNHHWLRACFRIGHPCPHQLPKAIVQQPRIYQAFWG